MTDINQILGKLLGSNLAARLNLDPDLVAELHRQVAAQTTGNA